MVASADYEGGRAERKSLPHAAWYNKATERSCLVVRKLEGAGKRRPCLLVSVTSRQEEQNPVVSTRQVQMATDREEKVSCPLLRWLRKAGEGDPVLCCRSQVDRGRKSLYVSSAASGPAATKQRSYKGEQYSRLGLLTGER